MKYINKSSLLAFVFFTIAFLTVLMLPAQKLYSLKGQITDAATQKPISKAIVQIPGTKYSDTCNKDGFYTIKDLPAGTNTIYIFAENYTRKIVSILIKGDRTLNKSLESIFPKDLPKENLDEDVEIIPDEKIDTPKEEIKKPKKVKKIKMKKPKVKKKTKKELIAIEFARKSIYEKLIENIVAFENLYFSEFELHKKYTTAIGFFSVENKQIYLFEAEFEWDGDICTLKNIEINLKGVQ